VDLVAFVMLPEFLYFKQFYPALDHPQTLLPILTISIFVKIPQLYYVIQTTFIVPKLLSF
jgi:hypothetical protein